MTNNKPPNNADGSNEGKGLSILFADDERSLQELMKLEIPRMGHRVTVCPDGIMCSNVRHGKILTSDVSLFTQKI